ncbi:MAG: sulfatase-like hydrolase/transferase, partial [Planctomycetes bacterium]|nr:sulfatase-like hydrolase/transferase [Planctomycetota bacterium]
VDQSLLTKRYTGEAIKFIKSSADKPFFLYLAFNAVHLPMQALEDDMAKFPEITDENRLIYAGMTEAMDRATGDVLDKLRELKLEENTLVFFISDNGGPTASTTSSNAPLRGYKGWMYEGGIRIPFMMQWKGRLPAGKVYDYPVSTLDVQATAAAAAGEKVLGEWQLDGVNLLPYVEGKDETRPHETLFWRSGGGSKFAIRHGDWKLVLERESNKPLLFNLAADSGETTNLASIEKEKAAQLQAIFDDWSSQMEDPRWVRQTA